jgi:hypothetical protein
MPDMKAVLDKGHALAIEMVDLIQKVDLAEVPDVHPASVDFSREATMYVNQHAARQHLKRTIDRLVPTIRQSPWEMRKLDFDPVCVAAKLVTTAIKAMVAAVSPRNRWVLDHRLCVKFENCTELWIEDENIRPEDLVVPSA